MEVAKGVHWIMGSGGNCFLVVNDRELLLVDTGFSRTAKKVMEFIREDLHRDPTDLKTIVLTHSHYDHVGGANELKEWTGAKAAAHVEDAGFIEGMRRPPPPKGATGVLVRLFSPLVKARNVKIDMMLNDGDTIGGMKVIHVPGHTMGSIALLDSVRSVLFSGDALTFRGGKVTPPPRGFTVNEDLARQSIAKMASLEFETMLGGHGEPLTPNASAKVREFLTTAK